MVQAETTSRWQPWALLGLGVLVAGAFVVGQPRSEFGPGPCSEVATGTIHESQEFTPAEQQRGLRPERPIVNGPGITPLPRSGVPLLIDGRPLQYAIASGQGPYLFYLNVLLDREMTRSDFLKAGGLAYEALSIDEGEPFPPALMAQAGDRATPVAVGEYDGALVWADPTEDNVRAHGLYWADETTNYSLVAVRGAEYLVNLGRGLVCGFHL
jgi:hypothetical protein